MCIRDSPSTVALRNTARGMRAAFPMPPTLAGIIGNAARIPLAVFLSATVLGLDGVWWSISISSIAKGIVVFTWFVVILRRYTPVSYTHLLTT